jgi:NhaA family Na+:H+ antiporter
MAQKRPTKLDPPVDLSRDHWLGEEDSELTLVEYGNYARDSCHAAHEVVAALRDRFGSRMRYVFRHRPAGGNNNALRAAELAEFAYQTNGEFWPVHDALMKRGPAFTADDFEQIAREFKLPSRDGEHAAAYAAAKARVQEDVQSAKRSGVIITPTFFINGRRYEGPWDESTLAEAMLGTLGHRLHAATVDFIRWAPSAGFLLLAMSILAVALANSPLGSAFTAHWATPMGVHIGGGGFTLPLLKWINDGLLAIFFLFVGLEIKREFTVGRLSTLRSGALPVVAAFGGIALPIVIYLLIAPPGPMAAGWGVPIATDTAFAVAIMVLLGARVSVELRVFLTAAVIIDDLVAIAVIALFYTDAIHPNYLIASVFVIGLLVAFNRSGIYSPLPYAVLGVALWICLHEAGLHATLAGVILALVTPTLPPANFRALLAQAEAILRAESKRAGEALLRHGPSEPALRALDAIHGRMESPADKLLRSVEPWSSFCVLPIFALANAGVILSLDVFAGHSRLMLAIILGLVVGKPLGIFAASWLAVRFHIAVKPKDYSWRQLAGAGALAGIGFTMSLFIAGEAFPDAADFAAAKIAIFIASIVAGVVSTVILLPKQMKDESSQSNGTRD